MSRLNNPLKDTQERERSFNTKRRYHDCPRNWMVQINEMQ